MCTPGLYGKQHLLSQNELKQNQISLSEMPTARTDLVLKHGCLLGVPLDHLIKLSS